MDITLILAIIFIFVICFLFFFCVNKINSDFLNEEERKREDEIQWEIINGKKKK